MKKKPKISYRDLAKPDATLPGAALPSAALPGAEPASSPPTGARGQAPGTAQPPDAAAAPEPAAPPNVPAAPRRVSSPVDVAVTLRLTPPVGFAAIKPAAPVSAAAVSAVPDSRPLAPDTRPLAPDPQPAAEPVAATVEDYATTLMRRLAAMAPAELDADDESFNDRRPLRERVRERTGVAELLMFRIGDELFATDLASVEEAVALPEIHHLPEMPAAMLGAFNLRGRLTPVYSPSHVIGVPLRGEAQAALLVRSDTRRLGLAVDDVEDVFQVDLTTVREAPGTDDTDGILLGVAHHGHELVAIVDAEALVAACVTGHAMEITA